MRNQYAQALSLLKSYPLEEQIVELDLMIQSLVNRKNKPISVDKRYDGIKQLKQMKHNILNTLNTHKNKNLIIKNLHTNNYIQ